MTDLVVADLAERKKLGTANYGKPLSTASEIDALREAYEEALDLCLYLRLALEERDA